MSVTCISTHFNVTHILKAWCLPRPSANIRTASATEFRLITIQGTNQDTRVSGLRVQLLTPSWQIAAWPVARQLDVNKVRCQSAPVRRCLLIDKTLKDLASGRKTSGGGHFIALVYTRGVGGLTGGRWVRRARVWAVKVKWHVHSANCWRWRWAHRQRWLVDALVIECPVEGALYVASS